MKQELAQMKNDYKYGFHVDEEYVFKAKKGLSEDIVREISRIKKEPAWMLDFRLRALHEFWKRPMPTWGANLSSIDFQDIYYYLKPTEGQVKDWNQLPDNIKKTFDRLGIPEAERNFLAGAGAQFDSETVYHKIREDLSALGVIFCDMDTGLREHPNIVKRYFGTVVPYNDNKFAALNSATWSGGSFVYVPEGVKVELPLQAYFRINAQNMGQFERTLIIGEPGCFVSYLEGCTAPVYASDSLHAAVVEVIALENARIRYTTIQNWSNNVYNLVTKRAFAHKNATVEWIDGNLGSKITMKYPSVYLLDEGAKAEMLSIAFAGKGQHQDAGAKAVHMAPNTTSTIISKSISTGGGRTTYRGLLRVDEGCHNVKSHVKCDALILDDKSASDTVPYMEINEKKVSIGHEATTGKISEDQVFYLMSRGLSEQQAMTMIVSGFIEPFVKELPIEYAIELNRLIQMEMEGSVG
ncbi:MAG: Fe-S cluster assembly protein SufB [Candidatus Aenigmarchaeota archaeon]|nr:Fe-S cluster assembly protein SufB [Candidatus Aenigmarchaeota archaeon]